MSIEVEILRSRYGCGSACKVRVSGTVRGIPLRGESLQFLDIDEPVYSLVRRILDGRVYRKAGGRLPFASEHRVYDAVLEHLQTALKPGGRGV